MNTTAEAYAEIKAATIKQSDRGPVVFIVMGLCHNFNIKRGRLRR